MFKIIFYYFFLKRNNVLLFKPKNLQNKFEEKKICFLYFFFLKNKNMVFLITYFSYFQLFFLDMFENIIIH